jgi:predicted DNA-binding transcriptional regulator AlpA
LNPDFLSIKECCALIGGDKPISAATFYRGIHAGRFPPPEHPSPGISRWRRAKLIEALETGTAMKAVRP